jgi:cytoskeletal protein CcmA (bactofilin family)
MTPIGLTVLVLGAGAGLFALPLLPSFLELRRRQDAQPLRVPSESRVDSRWFAQRFQAFIHQHLDIALAACRRAGVPVEGKLVTGEEYLVLPGGDPFVPSAGESRARRCNRLIASSGTLRLASRLVHEREVYAGDTLHVGDALELRAALALQGVQLAPRVKVQRWIHAGEWLHVAPGCDLRGRASAGVSIVAGGPFAFERLRAESIELGHREYTEGWRGNAGPLREVDPRQLPGFQGMGANRALVDGDVVLPEGSSLSCDLVAWGDVRVGRNCFIRGSLKSHGSVLLGEGCRVDGSLVAQQDLRIGTGCRIRGPVLAERALRIETRCEVGESLRPATICAPEIEIRMGTLVHGVIWATRAGRVVA